MPIFAKRHYEAIAQAMQSAHPGNYTSAANDVEQFVRTLGALASAFKADNAAFDVDRFKAACRPGANVKARA